MRLPLAALLLAVASTAFSQAETEPGNLWDVTTSMEMTGMKMPGQKQQVCAPVNAEGPEAMSGDKRCQMTDIKRSPGRFSYNVQCPDGTGTGEMTYQGKDSYTSKMTMTTGGNTMTMVSTGKRVGSCDASKIKKQVAAVQAQAAAGAEQMCAEGPKSLMPSLLESGKCDARYKKQLCNRFNSKDGFRDVAKRQPTGNATMDSGTLSGVSSYCGVQSEAVRDRLCIEANKSEDLDFLGEQCPALAQPIAQRECAGRSFSSPPAEKYRSFCSNYARGKMQGGESSDETSGAPPTKSTDMMKEGAKRLKGLFGR